MFRISIESDFSAAHKLRGVKGSKCENLHGHNWRVKVHVESRGLDKNGMVMDFKDLHGYLAKILARLDHKYMNEIPPFNKINPSSENIADYIFRKLAGMIKKKSIRVSQVDVWESTRSMASKTAISAKR